MPGAAWQADTQSTGSTVHLKPAGLKDADVSRRVKGQYSSLAEPVLAKRAAGSLETLMADGALRLVLRRHSCGIWLEGDAICAAGLWLTWNDGWEPEGLRNLQLQCSTGSHACI